MTEFGAGILSGSLRGSTGVFACTDSHVLLTGRKLDFAIPRVMKHVRDREDRISIIPEIDQQPCRARLL